MTAVPSWDGEARALLPTDGCLRWPELSATGAALAVRWLLHRPATLAYAEAGRPIADFDAGHPNSMTPPSGHDWLRSLPVRVDWEENGLVTDLALRYAPVEGDPEPEAVPVPEPVRTEPSTCRTAMTRGRADGSCSERSGVWPRRVAAIPRSGPPSSCRRWGWSRRTG